MGGNNRILGLVRRVFWPALALIVVDLLDPRRADPDLAEEMVRDKLGLVRPDEVIVPLD